MTSSEFNSNLIAMRQYLQRFALSLTSNRINAMDLLQETYLKAMINREKFVELTNLKAWISTIMKNNFINNYRRSIRERTMIDATNDLYYNDISQKFGSVCPEVYNAVGDIEKAIESLSNEFRIPFRMHIEGFKYEEISLKLGLKMGTVKSRIFFARKKLMMRLKDYEN